jgi:hypothetical protein
MNQGTDQDNGIDLAGGKIEGPEIGGDDVASGMVAGEPRQAGESLKAWRFEPVSRSEIPPSWPSPASGEGN